MWNTLSTLLKVCRTIQSFVTQSQNANDVTKDCTNFREQVWGKKLVTCVGVKKLQWAAIKVRTASLSLWALSGTLSVVFTAETEQVKQHIDLKRKRRR